MIRNLLFLFLLTIDSSNAFVVQQQQLRVLNNNIDTRSSISNKYNYHHGSLKMTATTSMTPPMESKKNNRIKRAWNGMKSKITARKSKMNSSLLSLRKEKRVSVMLGILTASLVHVTRPVALAAAAAAATAVETTTPVGKFLNFVATVKRQWKPIVGTMAGLWMIVNAFESRSARRRQALDATSEWSRYAIDPAARGRAVMMISLQILPLWIRQYLTKDKDAKKKLRTESGEVFANELLKLGPLYIKLGQILSCRENLLPEEWISSMERLQDRVPAKSGQEALDLAYSAMSSEKEEDGKAAFERTFSNFDTKPLAAASLGQVHRAEIKETGESVAIKLQRPNLRQIYDQDLALLTKIATFVDKIPTGDVGGVSQSWTEIFSDAKEILYREIDYRDEADNAMRFNRDFGLGLGGKEYATTALSLDGEALKSAAPWLRSPHIYRQLSSEKLLVMEYVPSTKITNFDSKNLTMEDREYLADSLARAYLRSFCNNRFFSTDPHPGNLGIEWIQPPPEAGSNVKPKPRLVMYDFGQACELQTAQAEGILTTIESIVDMDADRCVTAFSKMGVLKEGANFAKVRAKIQDNFETGKVTVKRKKLKKAGYKFKDELPDAKPTATTNNSTEAEVKVKDSEVMGYFTLPAEYAFVARALSQMDGVGKVLDPDFDFISSAAPYIVEIKGGGMYLQDEWKKWMSGVTKQFENWKL